MADNLREFELALSRFTDERTPEAIGQFRDAVALEALRGVVLLTPVDTGRLRGNWQTTVGAPATGHTPDKLDPSGGETINAGASVIDSAEDPFQPLWLHNGVPYSEYVNDGTEKTTAVHMVEQTVERLRRRFG